ncbi:hypothetical protein U0C82_12640 [Fulvimarina sp. 2208YS6-2-32]|uniref:Phasin protein n=1 Tax=Fulvimarina uroteuthidis TaxID=3098149 RepID=A0ABU5I3Q9_9HYPH|nr:hypothetical protein [Fulvimarina sp. 2208YS6-2-32]MDY8109987.1 hypothetical protein [Fulvimarina sp. 2208YS6-2-32]
MARTRKRGTSSSATLFPKSAVEASAIMVGAPFVIATRLTQMALAGGNPSAGDLRENRKMVAEKVAAVQQSAFAFNQAMMKSMMDMPFAFMTANPLAKSADAIVSAALKPYSSKVKANRKRLSK